jgi:hypothetical protein
MNKYTSSATTWKVTDKISVTFHDPDSHSTSHAVTIFPAGTRFKVPGWSGWEPFPLHCSLFPGIMTTGPDITVFIDDGTDIWVCTEEGVHKGNTTIQALCEHFIKNGILFEHDGTSTYLLLKNERFPLTHVYGDWVELVDSGALTVLHSSGKIKIAKMVKTAELKVSAYHLNALLEVCHE